MTDDDLEPSPNGGPLTSERARELGKLSGASRRRLTLDQVEQDLGPLQCVDQAQHRLERLGVWCASGLLSGSQGGAAVRACEVWIRAHVERVERDALDDAQRRVQELEREVIMLRSGLAELRNDPKVRAELRRILLDHNSPQYGAALAMLTAYDDERRIPVTAEERAIIDKLVQRIRAAKRGVVAGR